MNAAETIQAAIDKLIRLRNESNSGPWSPVTQIEDEGGNWAHFDLGGSVIIDADFNNSRDYADAQLISTLHATIDAQIELLEGHRKYAEASWLNVGPDDVVVKLARAILGQ